MRSHTQRGKHTEEPYTFEKNILMKYLTGRIRMKKVDYKKDMKELYLPKAAPAFIQVPPINYITVTGEGDPNEEGFTRACEALYSLAYAVKMSYKGIKVPEGYYEYTVFPLEGVWGLADTSKPVSDKSNYKYEIMIRQPDFLTKDLFDYFLSTVKKKKPNPYLERASFKTITEGLCCQMLHLGSYDDEPASFSLMEKFCADNGCRRSSKEHREIYLSDPKKTRPEALKTVLRFRVEKED